MPSETSSSVSEASHPFSSPALRKAMTDFAAGTVGGISGKIIEYEITLPFLSEAVALWTLTIRRAGIHSTQSRSGFKPSARLLPAAPRLQGRWTAYTRLGRTMALWVFTGVCHLLWLGQHLKLQCCFHLLDR
jgi:hypothetical protein